MKANLDSTQMDTAQLAAMQAMRASIAEYEHLKTIRYCFAHHHFSVSHVERHGDNYRINLLFWPRRYPKSRWNAERLNSPEALRKRVAKAGYTLLGYSDKADDMHLIVGESAKGVQS